MSEAGMSTAQEEVQQGTRFAFGRNWASFLETLDEGRIQIAVASLQQLLKTSDLSGQTFLDMGCGSGLFSLAAYRLGARVTSIDFDPGSVACAETLRSRFADDAGRWTINGGSALDGPFLRSLGEFDVVYSWGVLHHTGAMWTALDHMVPLVRPGGLLALALYNDQGWRSRAWLRVKQIYCRSTLGRCAMTAVFFPWFFIRTCLVSAVRRRNDFADYRRKRGMSIAHDWVDWLGGLPFEVATFNEVQSLFERQGFTLINQTRTHRLGCSEFVFRADAAGVAPPG